MGYKAISIRPFIGAKSFETSRRFYLELGFIENSLTPVMSSFAKDGLVFYLQDAYVRDWIDNSMIFIEVDNAAYCWEELAALNLPAKYENVRLLPVRNESWGRECFLHDPSGVLWHFGEFNK